MINTQNFRKHRAIDHSKAKQNQMDKFSRKTETSWFKDKAGQLVRATSATSVNSHGAGAARHRSLSGHGKGLFINRKNSTSNPINEKLARDKPAPSDEILHLASLGKQVGNNINKIRR